VDVSVLFSEPKIPQSLVAPQRNREARRFSALQRAENSSIAQPAFQFCVVIPRFSALQRAENSSIRSGQHPTEPRSAPFQCSSASRKFLNLREASTRPPAQRVSVLFSEPKIPQFVVVTHNEHPALGFSALQRAENSSIWRGQIERIEEAREFQCSSASRKFLNHETARLCCAASARFQCSSASRKFLNRSLGAL